MERSNPSHLLHSGFTDLLNLVASTPSRLGVALSSQSRFGLQLQRRPPPTTPSLSTPPTEPGGRYKKNIARANIDPSHHKCTAFNPPKDRQHVNQVKAGTSVGVGNPAPLQLRRVDKRAIGAPTNFRHIFHASTFEEATELLLRWSVEGVGDKIGDPTWAYPIKELVKARAREQQARAVAAVVEASRSRFDGPITTPGKLVVVNGLPSSIYSTANTIPPILRSSTPMLIAQYGDQAGYIYSDNYFSSRSTVPETPTRPSPPLPPLPSPLSETHTVTASVKPIVPLVTAREDELEVIAREIAGLPITSVITSNSSLAVTGLKSFKLGNVKPSPARKPVPEKNPVPKKADLEMRTPTPVKLTPVRIAQAAPKSVKTSPVKISPSEKLSPPTKLSLGVLSQSKRSPTKLSTGMSPKSPSKISPRLLPRSSITTNGRSTDPTVPAPLPFRIIKPSLETLERAMSIALFFEQYYHALLRAPPICLPPRGARPDSVLGATRVATSIARATHSPPIHPGNYLLSRARRLAQLEASFFLPENNNLSERDKDLLRDQLTADESAALRERRRRVDSKAFEVGRVIGHGAFGVVRIARERESSRLVAMKQLRKADMLRKAQEGHVKAEKDILAAAASSFAFTAVSENAPSWIVQLYYAFQDTDHLYLVLEYMGGGDLLNLLVERDTFSESMTKFYVAEMVLALEQTHQLGYIHRDIKPDNFLFTPEGHIRVSDFGLATDLHWAHDSGYYEQQRQALLKKHGIHIEESLALSSPSTRTGKTRMKRSDIERVLGKEWLDEGRGLLTWRDKNRKKLAYSVCGTNSYMAPEVIRGQGYGFSCDWWSLGVIMYEALYGYPPFASSSRHITRKKILDWKNSLQFPALPHLSPECTDLMLKLLCEPEDRLGAAPPPTSSALGTTSGLRNGGSSSRHVAIGVSPGSAFLGMNMLGSDGADEIKAHPWFADIDWSNLHRATPPYQPNLACDDDTRHFDDDIPDEPLAPVNGAVADTTKDPLLGHKTHGAHLLEIRKSLAFKGWTFKSPLRSTETRYGHLTRVSSGIASSNDTDVDSGRVPRHDNLGHLADATEYADAVEFSIADLPDSMAMGENEVGTGMGTVRSRALSL